MPSRRARFAACSPTLLALVLAGNIAAAPAASALPYSTMDGRKASDRDLAVEVERVVLANGMVALLARDAVARSVWVRASYRAGALYEPPGRSGLAHLVEHVFASGPTPDTDYQQVLEERRARHFNALTDAEEMAFDACVPPEELPAALWSVSDRVGAITPLVDAALVERHRRVVRQERLLRVNDAPYGLVDEQITRHLFLAPHPLRGGVAGVPAELQAATAEEVRAFANRLLVPANGLLVVAGAFDPQVVRELLAATVGRLPPGTPAADPAVPQVVHVEPESYPERVSRDPRVTMGWRIPNTSHDDALVLQLGSQILTLRTDFAFGMRVGAQVQQVGSDSLFLLSVQVPFPEEPAALQQDAVALLRQLTQRDVAFDTLLYANLALERLALFDLDSLAGRVAAISSVERLFAGKRSVAQEAGAHWRIEPVPIHHTARQLLGGPHVTVHARPVRPRPARREIE